MAYQLPISVSDLKSDLNVMLAHTRGFSDTELFRAVNFGIAKAVRAVSAVRGQLFHCWVNNFTLAAAVNDVDLSSIEPKLWRPVRLHVYNSSGYATVRFRYQSMTSQISTSYEVQAQSGAVTGDTILYDLMSGLLPLTTQLVTLAVSTTSFKVASPSSLFVGQPIRIAGRGADRTVAGGTVTGQSQMSIVTAIDTGTSAITIAPAAGATPQPGDVITPFARMIMRLANPPSTSLTGRLYYQYRPEKVRALTDTIDPVLSEYDDLITHYAASLLLRATNDSEADTLLQIAEGMRKELMQDLDPAADGDVEAFGSDLMGTD